MNNLYSSDKPISNSEDDKFQRHGFSKRIASTILNRKSLDSLVIGIYGAWGEGKTSVINFIENELKKEQDIIIIKFNPWRYGDEDSLLRQYFQTLASALKAKIKSTKERIGDLFSKYNELLDIDIPVPGVPNIGKGMAAVGKLFPNADIETIKERITNVIIESNKKIVIFIDDIDRLDKQEIHSVFRIVKLTADFPNTVYILSFDEAMVSAALGDRFISSESNTGASFLDKIIQVPLNLPVAQPKALMDFCLDLIESVVSSNDIKISQEELKRFSYHFSTNILSRLSTPRLAVRYGNSLSFTMPLLYGEANMVDLMLIEGVKIFYPDHYAFIKSNAHYFVDSNNPLESKEVKKQEIINHLERLGSKLNSKQRQSIKSLLISLFPTLEESFNNRVRSDFDVKRWISNQNIASDKYFNRFFSYSVIKGEISDIRFGEFIDALPLLNTSEIEAEMYSLVSSSSPENFIFKLRSNESEYSWEQSIKLMWGVSAIADSITKRERSVYPMFADPYKQILFFIYQLLMQHSNRTERYNFAKELISSVPNYIFSFDLVDLFNWENNPELRIFTEQEYIILDEILIQRILIELEGTTVFKKFPNKAFSLIRAWFKIDKKSLENHISRILEEDNNNVLDVLKTFTSSRIGYDDSPPVRLDFSKESFDILVSMINKDLIAENLLKVNPIDVVNSQSIIWNNFDPDIHTDLNLVRQFFAYYNNENPPSHSD